LDYNSFIINDKLLGDFPPGFSSLLEISVKVKSFRRSELLAAEILTMGEPEQAGNQRCC
jgi:hypothetical protein